MHSKTTSNTRRQATHLVHLPDIVRTRELALGRVRVIKEAVVQKGADAHAEHARARKANKGWFSARAGGGSVVFLMRSLQTMYMEIKK